MNRMLALVDKSAQASSHTLIFRLEKQLKTGYIYCVLRKECIKNKNKKPVFIAHACQYRDRNYYTLIQNDLKS